MTHVVPAWSGREALLVQRGAPRFRRYRKQEGLSFSSANSPSMKRDSTPSSPAAFQNCEHCIARNRLTAKSFIYGASESYFLHCFFHDVLHQISMFVKRLNHGRLEHILQFCFVNCCYNMPSPSERKLTPHLEERNTAAGDQIVMGHKYGTGSRPGSPARQPRWGGSSDRVWRQ
jgi:hypothetical protein